MEWVALDVGGANIKVADGRGYAARYSFALWKDPGQLEHKVRAALAEAPRCDRVALTMTGELADCFANRSEGVQFIVQAVQRACDGRHLRVYLVDGRLVSPAVVEADPLAAAASNWHALARYSAQWVPSGCGLLIDVGSTTTDIIPLADGQVATAARTDTERLLSGQLVYTGVERSPICGLVETLPYRGQQCPVMHEWFATTLDVYLLLEDIAESASHTHTADGRPATKAAARQRIARMIGSPEPQFHHRDAIEIARAVAEAQLQRLCRAVQQVLAVWDGAADVVILSGQGEFLARRVVQRVGLKARLVSLTQHLGRSASIAAPAHALAALARQNSAAPLRV
jgi:probable H4MPT-linked C1 transfer pathway protein